MSVNKAVIVSHIFNAPHSVVNVGELLSRMKILTPGHGMVSRSQAALPSGTLKVSACRL